MNQADFRVPGLFDRNIILADLEKLIPHMNNLTYWELFKLEWVLIRAFAECSSKQEERTVSTLCDQLSRKLM